MANNDPRRRTFGQPALLLLATGGILTVSLWAGTRCLSQGWSGDGMPGHGRGVGGPGQMGRSPWPTSPLPAPKGPRQKWYGQDVPIWGLGTGWGWQNGMGMGVMMASMAQTNSQHPELRQLQQAMVRAQSDEIQQVTQWYRSWYGSPQG